MLSTSYSNDTSVKGSPMAEFLQRLSKEELFLFISQEPLGNTADSWYHLLTTKDDLELSNEPTDLTSLSPCQQEEADTRIMLRLHHAAEQGHTKAYIRTVDSDVVVLAINLFHKLCRSLRAVDRIKTGKSVHRYSNPPYLANAGTSTLPSTPPLPCILGVRYCISDV